MALVAGTLFWNGRMSLLGELFWVQSVTIVNYSVELLTMVIGLYSGDSFWSGEMAPVRAKVQLEDKCEMEDVLRGSDS